MMKLGNKERWGNSLPLISMSLVSDQSLNMLLISSCSMSDTVEPLSIVLKCMCVACILKKMARLFQELKLDFDRKNR